MLTRITSRKNSLILESAALQEKKYRDKTGLFLIEGKKLASEAFSSGLSICTTFVTESTLPFALSLYGAKDEAAAPPALVCLPDSVFEKISTEKAPQGIICVARQLETIKLHAALPEEQAPIDAMGRILILSSLRDPGNFGTVIRTARAFGIGTVLCSSDCADPYAPRTVRAAMGTLFRQSIQTVDDLPGTIARLRSVGKQVYAAMLDARAIPLPSLEIGQDTVFVVGNEGHGIDPATAAACTGAVVIPMAKDSAESLNASVAAALLLWQSFQHITKE